MSDTTKDRIEAARARGLTVDQTAAKLGVKIRTVEAVWDAQDKASLDPDDPSLDNAPRKREHSGRLVDQEKIDQIHALARTGMHHAVIAYRLRVSRRTVGRYLSGERTIA